MTMFHVLETVAPSRGHSYKSHVFRTGSYSLILEWSFSDSDGFCGIAGSRSAKITKRNISVVFVFDSPRVEGDNENLHNAAQFAIQIQNLPRCTRRLGVFALLEFISNEPWETFSRLLQDSKNIRGTIWSVRPQEMFCKKHWFVIWFNGLLSIKNNKTNCLEIFPGLPSSRGYFRIVFCLCDKTNLRTKLFIWKCAFPTDKWRLFCHGIFARGLF